jgi:hypothetical protein
MIELLADLRQSSVDRLERRCHGLTDEEFCWETGRLERAAQIDRLDVWVLDEIHHGAEIALLRDLYLRIG